MQIPKWPIAGDREIELLRDVLKSSQWGGFQEIVSQFESAFASYQHCSHGISAANGTVTLEMLLECAGIGPGDEVIVPAISFISTATAVSRCRAVPVFVDIEPFSFNMDPDRAAAAITPRTKAILLVHFGGPMASMDRFTDLARQHGLLLLEDAAHAHGSEWNGRRAGSFGLAGSFSFQNGKVLTAGEGGMITTNDSELAARLRSFANQGREPEQNFFFHFTLGTNLRLTALQAAVLTGQFEKLPGEIALRAARARLLRDLLAGVPGLVLQQYPAESAVHSWYLLLGRVDASLYGETRDEFHMRLTAAGIPCTPFYPHPLYGNPLYRQGGCRVEPCPNAEACIRDAFWLPHRVLMAGEETIGEVAGIMAGRRG
jgi:dTDP-4-amino-4,6-dideoxygalactose transaminase